MYLAVTCHWIDASWKLQDALLEFKHVPGHHTGETLANEVFEIIERFGITEKLFCITMDNASNNGKMMRLLSHRLKEEKNIDWDPKEHHIACLNHVISLSVEEFMKAIKGYENDDNRDNDDVEDEDHVPLPPELAEEGIVSTVFKIRTIAKVLQM